MLLYLEGKVRKHTVCIGQATVFPCLRSSLYAQAPVFTSPRPSLHAQAPVFTGPRSCAVSLAESDVFHWLLMTPQALLQLIPLHSRVPAQNTMSLSLPTELFLFLSLGSVSVENTFVSFAVPRKYMFHSEFELNTFVVKIEVKKSPFSCLMKIMSFVLYVKI